ncbi:MAG: hypothetical protein QME12_05940 [Nanoarchaeota archaeon]|nr:hypothetical protein [Nanoarchaeota archaeon]
MNTYGALGGTTAGVFGSTTNAAKYGGYFQGGKGLYASKIEFAGTAFDESDGKGFLILGARVGYGCNIPCSGQGLSCVTAFYITGTPCTETTCANVAQNRQCFCGSA